MLWPHELNTFSEQLNERKVYDYGATLMENFAGTTKDITIENDHTWVFPVCILYTRSQGNIVGLPYWEPLSCAGIFLGHSTLHVGSVDLVLKP